MNSEVNTLQNLKISLDHDLGSQAHLISILEKHHDFLDESLSVLLNPHAYPEDKQLHLTRFIHVINMHGTAEEETLYPELMHSDERAVRLQAFVSQDETDLAFQLAHEVKEMGLEWQWTEEIDAKAKVMAALMKNHLKDEEQILFPMAKRHLDAHTFEKLTPIYLDKCIQYLESEMLQVTPERGTQPTQEGFL